MKAPVALEVRELVLERIEHDAGSDDFQVRARDVSAADEACHLAVWIAGLEQSTAETSRQELGLVALRSSGSRGQTEQRRTGALRTAEHVLARGESERRDHARITRRDDVVRFVEDDRARALSDAREPSLSFRS